MAPAVLKSHFNSTLAAHIPVPANPVAVLLAMLQARPDSLTWGTLERGLRPDLPAPGIRKCNKTGYKGNHRGYS